jgi:hypothetical protein
MMALYDIDKHSEDRGSPMPNHSDTLSEGATKSHKTISTHYTTDADTNPGRIQMQNKQILGNDGTTNVTLYGYNPALNKWGFFVTQAGTEVTTNTDLSKFIFNSSQDIFKIVKSSTATLILNASYPSSNAPAKTTSVAHGLSTVPAAIAYFGMSNNNFPGVVTGTQYSMPYVTFGGSYRFAFSIDATNLNFSYYNDSGSAADFTSTPVTATFKYYILQETAS